MGSTNSKLKGDAIPDLISTTPPPSKPDTSSTPPPHTTNNHTSRDPTKKHQQQQPPTTPYTPSIQSDRLPQPSKEPSSFSSTINAETPPQEPSPTKPRKQSLKQRWKERRGVPEPKDENGRGLYSGKTTDELVKQARSQVVDGRIEAASAGG
jgi:hypothetical protein